MPGKRHCPIAIGHRPADRRGPRRAGDAQGHSYCILTEVTRCSLKQTEPAGDLCLSHNGNDTFVKREKALNESVARTGNDVLGDCQCELVMELVKGHRTRNVWNGLARLPRRGALAGAGAVARGGRASSSATPTGRRPTLHTFIYLIRLRPRSTDKNAPSTEPSLF